MHNFIAIGLLALFIILNFVGMGFMSLVMDTREDNKWDREIRKERKNERE